MSGKDNKKNHRRQKRQSEDGGMTIYDYEQKYVRKENGRTVKFFLRLLIAVIAIALFACMFSLGYRIYEIYHMAGYVAGAVLLVLYIAFFIVPVVRIMKMDYFKVNVDASTAGEAKRHNKKVRRDIAEKIVGVSSNVNDVKWYDDEIVAKLDYALCKSDNEAIKENLTALYNGSVKASAKSIIAKNSVKAGLFSAISQSSVMDTTLITAVNLQMIKDIIFLYGFRPTDARLARIFGAVVTNSLVAYGLGSINIGKGVAKTIGEAAKGLPVLGQAIAVLVDSSVQGLANGTLTAVIGFQTIRYLNYEYKLQNILDGIQLVGEDEEKEVYVEVEDALKNTCAKKTSTGKSKA